MRHPFITTPIQGRSCIIYLWFLFLLPSMANAQLQPPDHFEFEGLTRYYRVFLPHNGQGKKPVVFVLHGYTMSARSIITYTNMNAVADTAGFIAVYPEAVYPGFNSGLKNVPDLPPLPEVNDVGFISSVLDTLQATYDIDMARIYCCGLSNGGIMTYRLLGEIGERFAAFASVSGTLTDLTASYYDQTGQWPILHMHGTADPVVNYNGDANLWSVEETLKFWREKNNCSLQADTLSLPNIVRFDKCTVEKISFSDCSDDNILVFYKVIHGGHSWPGSPDDRDWDKPLNMDINAGSVIWNFFKNYGLADSIDAIESKAGSFPTNIKLSQNYPNPFNPLTTINYELPITRDVELNIYNLLGQKVSSLVQETQKAGKYKVQWDASALPSGVYYYQLVAGGFNEVKKMVLIK